MYIQSFYELSPKEEVKWLVGDFRIKLAKIADEIQKFCGDIYLIRVEKCHCY